MALCLRDVTDALRSSSYTASTGCGRSVLAAECRRLTKAALLGERLPRNLTFSDIVEEVLGHVSGSSRAARDDRATVAAERLHQNAATWTSHPRRTDDRADCKI